MQNYILEQDKSFSIFTKIIDDNFEIDHLHHYQLLIQISDTNFQFCVTDSLQNRCMLIEDYELKPCTIIDDYLVQLQSIYEDHILLMAGFWKSVKISIKNLKFSLVPSALFDVSNASKYMQMVDEWDDDKDILCHFKHQSNEMVNVFVAEKKIIQWFKKTYPGKNIELIHHTSLFIEALLQNNSPQNFSKQALFVSIESQIMTVVLKNGSKVEFCNNFRFFTDNDLLYFLLFVYEELELDTNIIPVFLTGSVHSDTETYRKLYKYIRYVNFTPRTQSLRFSYKFDELQDHSYYNLLAMHSF